MAYLPETDFPLASAEAAASKPLPPRVSFHAPVPRDADAAPHRAGATKRPRPHDDSFEVPVYEAKQSTAEEETPVGGEERVSDRSSQEDDDDDDSLAVCAVPFMVLCSVFTDPVRVRAEGDRRSARGRRRRQQRRVTKVTHNKLHIVHICLAYQLSAM
jgi:hypothetical protein